MKIKVPIVLILTLFICASYSHALIDLSIFGPKRYDRQKGAPTVYTDTFERCNPAQYALLKIQNGDGKETRIKAASVYVNGVEVVKENEFKQLVPYIEKTVPVKDVNELKVVLKSGMQDDPNNKLLKEQSFLVIEVVGKGCDDTPPTISNPQPADGSLLNNGRPVISASYSDNAGGTGIDAATASIKIDGADVISSASVSASGISYTPSSKLPDGEHTVTVSVSDKAHNRTTQTWRFTTDTIAPSIKITSHINNQYLNTPTITLSGTVSDDVAGNPSGGVIVTVNGHSATVSENTFTLSILSLSEGANAITVEAKDPAGNVGKDVIVINLDTAPPVVQITSPQPDIYVNTQQISINGTVNEPILSLMVNGVSVGANGGSPVLFDSNYTLSEGGNTITVKAKDRAGNVGTASININLDTVPPVVSIVNPHQGDYLNTPNISITGSINEPVTSLKVNGVNVGAISQSPYEFAKEMTLAEGSNTINLEVVDRAGNVGSGQIAIALDTIPPVINITAPIQDSFVNTQQIDVAGSVTELHPAGLWINDAAVSLTGLQFDTGLSLNEGPNTIKIKASDLAGNVSEASVSLTLDTILPIVAIEVPVEGFLINNPQMGVAGSVNEPVTSLTINGSSVGANGGSPVLFESNYTMVEGLNTITVQAVDRAGNTGTASVKGTLDTKAPAVKIMSHQNNQYLNTSAIVFTGTVSDDVTGNPAGGVVVTVNGVAAQVAGDSFNISNLSLSEGANTITVEAKDPAGNVGLDTIVINIDTIAPVISVTTPAQNSYSDLPNIKVTGAINEPVTSLTINGQVVTPDSSLLTPNFAFDVTLVPGLNTISLTATDLAGNVSTASVTVTLDSTPPVVTITAPASGSLVNKPGIKVTGTVNEPVNDIKINGVPIGAILALPVQFDTDLTLLEGLNNIIVQAIDRAGNSGTATVSVTVDSIAPSAPVIDALNTPTNISKVTITGKAEAGSAVKVFASGNASQIIGTVDADSTGMFSIANVALTEGMNSFSSTATDAAGNASGVSQPVSATLDTKAPVVKITSHQNNQYLNTATVTLTGTVSDDTLGNPLFGKEGDGGVTITVSGQVAAVSGNTFTLAGLNLIERANTVTVEARDPAGNVSTDSITINLDTVLPTINISSPNPNAYLNTPQITVTGTLNEPVTSLVVNGVNVGAIGQSPYGFTNGITLTEGENTITIVATDPAGNTATRTVTVTLDTAAPVISVTTPAQNSYADLPNISVSGTVTDLHPAGFWINDAPVEATGQSPLQFNTGLTLVPGLNTINLKATDLAGNVSNASVTVTLDSTPPVVTITAPATGSLLNKMGVKVTGTVNEAVTSLTINGLPVGANGGSPVHYDSDLTLLEGLNNIVVQAIDRAGNSGTASVSVTVDSAVPDAPVLDSLSTPTKVSPVTIAGSSEAGSTVKVIRSASGAQEQIGTATADSQGRFSIQNVTLKEGANTFTATATDAAENASSASLPISAVLDTIPPVIAVTAPANNSYTNVSAAKVTGSLNEDASLTINGTETRAIGQSPLQFEKDITLTSGINSIQLTARDAAGNQTTSTVLVTLDQTAPVITITSPVSGAVVGSSTVTVTGTVNETVSSLKINGVSVGATAVVSGQGPGVSFNLASLNLSDGTNTITVEATDKAGNTGTATMQVSVDSMPPVVTLNAPAEAAAGTTISISAGASDPSGVSLLELSANGVTIWSLVQPSSLIPQPSISYTLSPDLTTGTIINITAKAMDATGLTGTATATITVSQGPTGPGYIQGEVYEDLRGLRLEGATASLFATDGHGLTQMTTQSDGGYFFEATAGDYLITLSKPGYTTVERKISVKPEKNIAPLDARLTPISSTQNLIDAAGGKVGWAMPTNQIDLTIPANALTEQTDIRLTPLSNQGLIGVLPKGWSPIAVLNISATEGTESTEKTFLEAASLKVPVTPGITLEPASQVILAAYVGAYGDTPVQNPVHDWLVSSLGTVSSDGKFITASVPSTGQYAVIIPDQPLTSAPSASSAVKDIFVVSDSPINPLTDSPLFSATSKVKPAAAPPSVGLKAVGEVVITPSPLAGFIPGAVEGGGEGGLVSGFVVNAKVAERFDLLSGEVETPSDYIQDLILYRYPCITNIGSGFIETTPASTTPTPPYQGGEQAQVRTTFPISPSRDYSIIELMMGKVGLEITLPESDLSGTVVGPEGARLVDADGNVLNIPQGALTGSAPVEVKTIASSAITGIVGSDFTLLRAIDINLGGKVLSSTAELSIPAPQGINQNLPIVIARAIEVKGATKLKLVSLAKISGSLITSSALSASSAVKGLNVSGTYYFLQAKSPLGFVQGKVTDASNNPYPSALVTSNTCSLVDLTGTDGNYLIASKVSTFIATAADIYRNDKGIGSGTIASANQIQTVNLTIKVIPPHIISIAPDSGETAVDPKTSIVVTFSEAVDKNTVTSSNIYLKDSAGNTVSGVFSINPDGTEVTLYPSELLKSETTYTITVTKSIRDMQGYLMGQDVSSTFKIKDMTPPPMPPAGSITATFPDENGYVTINATQGSAEANATVLIINDTTGEIVSVTPQTNGSFTAKITAQLGDEIKIVLMDAAGNQTLISYITFKSNDGKYLVTAKGGTVEGEGGTKLIIPEGAFFGPTVVKISPVLEETLPHPVPAEGKFIGAVNIDTGGVKFQKEVKLSVPAPSGLPSDVKPFLTQPVVHTNVDGTEEKVYAVINSAKVIDGRVTTASPPFDGVLVPGMFVFVYSPPELKPVIVSGHTYINMDGIGGYTPGTADTADRPVKGAVIRTPAAMNFISYSDKEGHYAMFALNYAGAFVDSCGTFPITATHPFTMYKTSMTIQACAPYVLNDLNFKLGEKDTQCPDKSAPAITMNMMVVPGQTARITAGTVNVGTNLNVPISIIDQDMSAVTLTVNYSDPTMTTPSPTSIQVENTDTSFYSRIDGCPNGSMKYIYTPQFDGTGLGGGTYFKPMNPGVYSLVLEGTDRSGNKSTKSLQIRAVEPGEIPQAVDGPPRVDSIIPANASKEIMVTMPVTAYFNEPVTNVNETTFTLTDMTTGAIVPAYVYTGLEGGKIYATLQPKGNLTYGRNYTAKLSQEITDENPNPSHNNALLPLDQEYSVIFRTKVPQIYDLSGNTFQTSGSGGIDLFTDKINGKTYAYIAAGTKGWYVVDVTDPTMPVLQTSNNTITNTDYRGIAIEKENGTLGITENITFGSEGGQYGYVRFYDLNNTPVNPPKIGQEKLAEAYSGIPGRLALNGNYAYVATVMVGLQVVDIGAARNHTGATDGSTIAGIFDTLGQGFGQPSDIVIHNGTTALLTTTRGHLLLLDISIPQMPQLINAFKPDGYTAFRAASAAGFTYTKEDKSTDIMDIAVTSSTQGKINVINITDLYNPSIIGTTKDAAGNDVSIFARDIKISGKSGLAFITTGSAIYVIDIKDPYNPRLINTISETTSEDGITTTLGYTTALVEKDGWVYVANQQQGMKVVDFDPVFLKRICGEEAFCKDYYPALGEKIITLEGRGPISYSDFLKAPAKVKLIGTPPQGVTITSKDPNDPLRATFDTSGSGLARFYVKTDSNYTGDHISLNFEIDLSTVSGATQNLNTDFGTHRANVNLKVRNNSNTTLGEVLNGTAVFVYDNNSDSNHVGYSNGETDDMQKKFYFVQEMLNQVVPRKRTYTDANNNVTAIDYKIFTESGVYNNATVEALKKFKTYFGMGGIKTNTDNPNEKWRIGNTKANVTISYGIIKYEDDDDTTDIYRKLMKDYGHVSESSLYLHKIMDKATFVGKEKKDTDTIINEKAIPGTNPAKMAQDTGLYELYDNVVKTFIESMLEVSKTYADFNGIEWKDRSGVKRTGVSYSYGRKQKLDDYSATVEPASTQCYAPGSKKENFTLYYVEGGSVKGEYVKKKVKTSKVDENFNVLKDDGTVNCSKDSGNQYPGLFAHERESYIKSISKDYSSDTGPWKWPQFKQNLWAGIDCAGLVQRAMMVGRNENTWAENIGLQLRISRLYDEFLANGVDKGALGSQDFNCDGSGNHTCKGSTNSNALKTGHVYKMTASQTPLLERGDLVFYDTAEIDHVATIYSAVPSCENNGTTCNYELIHAYGGNTYIFPDIPEAGNDRNKRVFGRKAIKTWQNIGSTPTGFGRIKLWD